MSRVWEEGSIIRMRKRETEKRYRGRQKINLLD